MRRCHLLLTNLSVVLHVKSIMQLMRLMYAARAQFVVGVTASTCLLMI
jgi:hypothetical protein